MSDERSHHAPNRHRGPGANRAVEKPKEFKKTWAKLIRYSRSHLPMVIVAIVLIVISTIMQVLGPFYIKQITDGISITLPFPLGLNLPIDMGFITSLCLILILLYAISAICSFGQGWIMATVTQKISKKMRFYSSSFLIR